MMNKQIEVARYPMHIGGKAHNPCGGEWIGSLNPAMQEAWAMIPRGSATDAAVAAAAAHEALRGAWAKLTATQRGALMRAASFSPAAQQDEWLMSHLADLGRGTVTALGSRRRAAMESHDVVARLVRERGLGPWSLGVVCLEGLGRYEHGLYRDLGLAKLASALWGRWVEAEETDELLAPYGEWSGLASVYLLAGFGRGLVPLPRAAAA